MSEIQITIEDVASTQGQTIKIVKFIGQLDETNVDEKSKIIYDIIESVPKELYLIFDFSQLEYMNSKSVGYLTDWYTKVSEKGGGIIIANAKPNILDILEVVGLTQIIKFMNSLEEAKASLSESQPNPVAQTIQNQNAAPQSAKVDQSAPVSLQPVEQPIAPPDPTPTPAQPVEPVAPVPQTTEAIPSPQVAPQTPVAPQVAEATPAPVIAEATPTQPVEPVAPVLQAAPEAIQKPEQGSVEITRDAPPTQ